MADGSGPPARGTVLLLGNHLPSVHVARSLARLGYTIIAGDGGEYAPVRHSRSCHEVWEHPPISQKDALLEALAELVERRPDISIIIPLRPDYVALMATERQALPAGPVLATPDPEVVLTCLDKGRMYAIAREAGVPFQPMAVAGDLDDLIVKAREVGFPCVVRPTRDAHGRLPGSKKAVICAREGDVRDAFTAWPPGHPTLLVQRFASGHRHNVSFIAHQGRILASTQFMTVRTERLDGTGLAVEHVSVPPDPRLRHAIEALAERLGYTGTGMAQFLRPEVGEPSFLEINPRMGMGLGFAQYLGLEVARAACDIALGLDAWRPDPDYGYPVGRRSAWTSRDLYGLGMAIAHGEVRRGQVPGWLARTLRAAIRADFHQTWSWRDPGPTIAVYAHLARLFAGSPLAAAWLSRPGRPRRRSAETTLVDHEDRPGETRL